MHFNFLQCRVRANWNDLWFGLFAVVNQGNGELLNDSRSFSNNQDVPGCKKLILCKRYLHSGMRKTAGKTNTR